MIATIMPTLEKGKPYPIRHPYGLKNIREAEFIGSADGYNVFSGENHYYIVHDGTMRLDNEGAIIDNDVSSRSIGNVRAQKNIEREFDILRKVGAIK